MAGAVRRLGRVSDQAGYPTKWYATKMYVQSMCILKGIFYSAANEATTEALASTSRSIWRSSHKKEDRVRRPGWP